jgi:hypothetical protein
VTVVLVTAATDASLGQHPLDFGDLMLERGYSCGAARWS